MSAVHLDIAIADEEWRTVLGEAPEDLCRQVAEAVLRQLNIRGPVEISIVLDEDAHVAELNARYRGRQGPTNVLSFPGEDAAAARPGQAAMIGDIVIARQTLLREAAAQEKTPRQHFMHLLVHGILHLLGYDHQNEAEAGEMEGLEIRILAELDIPDPYQRERR